MANPLVTLLLDTLMLLFEAILALLESILRLFVSKPLKSLHGEIALITGAGHGIGKEIALQLSKLGVKVVLWDVNQTTCEATKAEVEATGGVAWAFKCDVAVRDEVGKVANVMRYVRSQYLLICPPAPMQAFLERFEGVVTDSPTALVFGTKSSDK